MDTIGTKDFVLYSEVSFAQGVIVASGIRPLPSAALDVLHHQHAEGRVWPLWQSFCDRCWNANMTNEIQARVMITKFE